MVNGVMQKACDWNGNTSNQVCTLSLQGSSYPLNTQVAVNAKVTDIANQITWTPLVYLTVKSEMNAPTTTSPINAWHQLFPQTDTLLQGGSVLYAVHAQSPNGLKQAEIIVNGVTRRICELNSGTNDQTCNFSLEGSMYPLNTQVAVNAKVTDMTNQIAWTPLAYLNVKSSTPSPTPSAQDISSTWIWSTPNNATISTMGTYHVGAWDGHGMSRIDIWVNGTLRRSCSYAGVVQNVECSWDILAADYAKDSNISVNAEVINSTGQRTWSASQVYHIPS
jgi:hypothetical protein